MNQHIVYKIQKKSGGLAAIKIVPVTIPGFNNRTSITGVFQLFYFLSNGNPRTAELDMDTYMGFAGAITFFNENFFEWRYDGQILEELEVAQLVKIIQDHVEEWFDQADNQPVLKEEDLHDPESAFYMSDAQLAAIMEHPLYDISPYFLFGPDDNVIGIVQNGPGFDIHINGAIVAHLEVFEEDDYKIVNGEIIQDGLTGEIVRRIKAVRDL
ncbi:hypothetical protein DIU31_022300 [Mucilaginibacter rubeus]|uniref:Uncharacterized protein n=2 Tax=Mucilaginibacter rubeus TaxID=2027860 RepID=A0A364WQR2_9SPHI|nr:MULTISPECIES: hypothetical protein [Mucilaginibacter]QEM06110.1 hypothetical protein DIU31_022300 [Mucilaginibacter rubeus]QEM13627.1 hypothetical protein DEO27_027655 [Mucilaginibacter rubeus]QEM18690.1 hypothetical protein DIU38_022525 [Mucilaginibacter gossypii]QTE36315.1 hypothetical protein J3L18_24770 [Mucilaginibacter gossypii]QTE44768.1 hypothetical protein J3L19_05195 [Mucilaginibacter rubeus]